MIDDYVHMIAAYHEACERLCERAAELSRAIDKARRNGTPSRELLERRQLLRCEIGELQCSIRDMREYVRATAGK